MPRRGTRGLSLPKEGGRPVYQKPGWPNELADSSKAGKYFSGEVHVGAISTHLFFRL